MKWLWCWRMIALVPFLPFCLFVLTLEAVAELLHRAERTVYSWSWKAQDVLWFVAAPSLRWIKKGIPK